MKMTIYVRDGLRKKMTKLKDRPNWSLLAQHAFERFVTGGIVESPRMWTPAEIIHLIHSENTRKP